MTCGAAEVESRKRTPAKKLDRVAARLHSRKTGFSLNANPQRPSPGRGLCLRRACRSAAWSAAELLQANDDRVVARFDRQFRVRETRHELVRRIAAQGIGLARNAHQLVELVVAVDVMVTDDRVVAWR